MTPNETICHLLLECDRDSGNSAILVLADYLEEQGDDLCDRLRRVPFEADCDFIFGEPPFWLARVKAKYGFYEWYSARMEMLAMRPLQVPSIIRTKPPFARVQ